MTPSRHSRDNVVLGHPESRPPDCVAREAIPSLELRPRGRERNPEDRVRADELPAEGIDDQKIVGINALRVRLGDREVAVGVGRDRAAVPLVKASAVILEHDAAGHCVPFDRDILLEGRAAGILGGRVVGLIGGKQIHDELQRHRGSRAGSCFA